MPTAPRARSGLAPGLSSRDSRHPAPPPFERPFYALTRLSSTVSWSSASSGDSPFPDTLAPFGPTAHATHERPWMTGSASRGPSTSPRIRRSAVRHRVLDHLALEERCRRPWHRQPSAPRRSILRTPGGRLESDAFSTIAHYWPRPVGRRRAQAQVGIPLNRAGPLDSGSHSTVWSGMAGLNPC